MVRGALARLAWTVMAGAAYVWPLDQPAAPTSTFGEYRGGHFHGGLDLSTQQIVGLPVRALDAGEVSRVRTSGAGYGRALYLRLDDGRTAVYGHLDGFAPDLAAWMAGLQDSTGSYEQDVEPPPGRFRFGRGDVVGFAGESGAGPPHLHFEVRSGETALNPQLVGLAPADGEPPVMAALWVYPASAAARVEGATAPRRLPLRLAADGRARAARRLRLSGPVRLAVEASDGTEARPNRLGVYALTAALDGEPVYEARFDSLSWLAATEADVVFDARVRAAGGADAYALTPPAGLGCLALARAADAWQPPPGIHALTLEATDAAGNTARAEVDLEWVAPGEEIADPWTPARGKGARSRVVGLEVEFCRDGVVVRGAAAGGVTANLPVLDAAAGSATAEMAFALPEEYFGPVEIAAPGASRSFLVAEARPGWTRELRAADGSFVLEIGSGALFERTPLAVETAAAGGPVLARYRVEPAWLPLRESAGVRLRLPDGVSPERVGLFRSGGGGRRFVGGPDGAAAGWLAGRTRALGEFVAVRDTVAPRVGAAAVRRGGVAPGAGARPAPWEVRWAAGDGGAGIDAAACTLEVDGRRVPVEYDPEAGVCRWRPPQPPAAGRHAYRLTVGDRLGNRGTRSGSFRAR